MNITFTNSGEVVNLTSAGTTAKYQYPIGAGISQQIRVTDVGTFTTIELKYFQNGDLIKTVSIPVRPAMVIDLSIFSSLTQSLPEMLKLFTGTLQRTDTIVIDALTGSTSYGFMRVGVTNIGSTLLGGFPGLYNNGNLWTNTTSPVISGDGASNTTLTKVQTYGMGFPDAVRVNATSTSGTPSFDINPTNNAALPATLNAFSVGIWFQNNNATGGASVKFQTFLNNQVIGEVILKPGQGGLFKYENLRVGGVSNKVFFRASGVSGTSMSVFYTRAQFNEGSTLRNWSPHMSEVTNSDNSKRYGFLTDYADGWKVTCEEYLQAFNQTMGYPFQDRIYWGSAQPGTATADLVKYVKFDDGSTTAVNQGYRINYANPNVLSGQSVSILNRDASTVYGTIRYKRIPNLPSTNCRVCMNWLNSYGTYDTLYSTEYNVVPTLIMQGTDGNKVQYYDVRITVPVTENNERALEVLMRSQHVRCAIPNAPFQWGSAEIVGNALSFYAGGSTVKSMTIRFKAQIIGNW
ncbi:hypothetical protein PM708P3_00033 [Parabacteroides phage PM708P3]|nr:hypothetical protein PM708P3_00033 [Parabacteroides phage PM708P3]